MSRSGVSDLSKLRDIRSRIRLADIVAPSVMATPPTIAYSIQSGQSPLGATAVNIPYNSNRVAYQACLPVDNTGLGFRDNGANGADAGGTWAIEFDHYGSSFVYNFRSFDTTGGTYQIYVDGSPVAASPFTPSGITPSAGGVYRMQVTFAAAALRHIRIQIYAAQYRGLDINATDSLEPGYNPTVKAVMYGDSFVGGALGIPQHTVFTATLGRILGWEFVNAGQGGTGYTHDSTASRLNYANANRIATACQTNPDFVIVFGTVNDDGAPSGAAVQNAATSVYSQFAAQSSAKLIVIGPPPQHTTIPAARTAAQAAVKAAALAASNVIAFIDPIAGTWQAGAITGGDGQQWVTGTGYSGATTGDGNADWIVGTDNVHPSQAGHDYYARRIAQNILDALKAVS